MELKDFIKHSLLDIVNGIEEANKEKSRFYLTTHKHFGTGQRGQKVEFDLSVIVNESSETGANGGIKVAFANLGGSAKEAQSNQNIHKIKFEVFISEDQEEKQEVSNKKEV